MMVLPCSSTPVGGPMSKRFGVNKGASAHKFRKHAGQTKAVNLPRQVMRGGWRL